MCNLELYAWEFMSKAVQLYKTLLIGQRALNSLFLFLLFVVRVRLSCVCACVHLFCSESCGFRCVLGAGGKDARLAYIFQSSDLFALFVVLPAVDGEASLHAAACAGRNLRRVRLHSH